MRVALIHYWFVANRGGEKVVKEILRLFPDADIFTHVHDPRTGPEYLRDHNVMESWISRLPCARTRYQDYLPFMPRALEDLDLSGYDLIISSESGPAKGVLADPQAVHVCYCHSPMRYLYDQRSFYVGHMRSIKTFLYSLIAHRLRQWDFISAQRVDAVAANSRFVSDRIRRYWGRESDVIYPPVDVEQFSDAGSRPLPDSLVSKGIGRKEYFLVFGEIAPYKRVDLAVKAAEDAGTTMVVAGDGKDLDRVCAHAGTQTHIIGRVPDEDLPGLLSGARSLVFPGAEDFGIIPLEAAACGTPTIAYRAGGALDTVLPGRTGVFFDEQTVDSLALTLSRFDEAAFSSEEIIDWAWSFRAEAFRDRFKGFVDRIVADKGQISDIDEMPGVTRI